MTTRKRVTPDLNRLDRIVADARRSRDEREQGYRAQALKLYPWICGRCAREFQQSNVHELTVHHKNHNHDDNPADGGNWELLCLYCHDNEHQRQLENSGSTSLREEAGATGATHSPFADLASLLKKGG
jgi:predicted HNH restriction endonuclease